MHTSARTAAGFTDTQAYRSTEDANDTVVINKIADRQRAEASTESEGIREENIKVDVIGIPEIYYAD